MTVREGAVISAHTGIMLCKDFCVIQKYIEEITGRPVSVFEMANKKLWDEIKQRSQVDFEEVIFNQTEE